jgi:hypothetical protein
MTEKTGDANICGMILAGTRHNIFVATMLPFLLWPDRDREARSTMRGLS